MKKEKEKFFYSAAFISGIQFKVFASVKGITHIYINEIDAGYSGTKLRPDDPYLFNVFNQLTEYFNLARKIFKVPLDVKGTEFQLKVWKELEKIPYGKTLSYKALSEKTGDLKAIRAVGGAVGANPVPIIIPCHRIINSDGSLGGFSCGLKIKEKLLELEGSLSMELFV